MTEQNILAVDVGTSEVKAALISYQGEIRDCARSHLELLHPEPTWAEQNPDGWWHAVTQAVRKLWNQVPDRRDTVTGLVFSCQMFGVLPVNAEGKPLMNAMIWLDTRSREQAREMTHGFPKVSGYGLGKVLKWLRETNGAPNLAGRDTISKYIWLTKSGQSRQSVSSIAQCAVTGSIQSWSPHPRAPHQLSGLAQLTELCGVYQPQP
ncbi:hypothetical protein MK280_19540 [Myxococcota bacterium]|nr:hypothetical protein [Myxococcota bacterium]